MAKPRPAIRRYAPAMAAMLLMVSSLTAHAHEVLTLGRISDDPKNHYAQLKPLLDYVVPRLAGLGVREGRILMARDRRQMVHHLNHARVDWITETAGMGMQLHVLADAQPLLLTERGGVRAYNTLIVSRADGPVRSLADLAGRSIAFEHVASTSAYLVPAAELLASGLRLEPLATLGDTVSDGGVGYLFARSEANIAIWIDKGLIDAGAMSNLGWANPRSVPEAIRSRLRIVHESAPVPRALELVRSGLDPALAQRLRVILLEAARDPQAAPALNAFFNTTAFLPIDHSAQRRLDELQADVRRVNTEAE